LDDPALDAFGYVYIAQENSIAGYVINQSTGASTPVPGTPIASNAFGPLQFAASGAFAYATSVEGSRVWEFQVDTTIGALTAITGSPFASSLQNKEKPYLTIDPSGTHVYVNGGAFHPIDAYAINASTGVLSAIAGSQFSFGTPPDAGASNRGVLNGSLRLRRRIGGTPKNLPEV
jgi:6-phosphogluconolactonase (cycloisomerase 2 family)